MFFFDFHTLDSTTKLIVFCYTRVHMEPTHKPSKTFLYRAGALVLITFLFISIKNGWFTGLFHKPTPEDTFLAGKESLDEDTNGNGIPNWEERLWGLDPTVLYTNGVPNKLIVEQKQQALNQVTTPESETDKLSSKFYAIASALSQSPNVDSATLDAIGKELINTVEFQDAGNHYSLSSLKTTKTTLSSLKTYYDSAQKVTEKYTDEYADIDVVINSLQIGDYSALPSLTDSATAYKQYAADLAKLTVPVGIQKDHLDVINSLYGIAASFEYLKNLDDDGLSALAGISIYKIYRDNLDTATQNLHDYFVRYGIL